MQRLSERSQSIINGRGTAVETDEFLAPLLDDPVGERDKPDIPDPCCLRDRQAGLPSPADAETGRPDRASHHPNKIAT